MLLFALSLFAVFLGANGAGCFINEKPSQDGKVCYTMFIGRQTFDEARKVCKRDPRSDLPSVHSNYDNDVISSLGDGVYWIGGNHRDTLNRWQWTDGTPFDYSNWVAGGPGIAGENDCVAVDSVTGLWARKDCNSTLNFACTSRPKEFATPPPTAAPPCPKDAACFNNFAYIVPDALVFNWTEAEKYCHDKYKHGHLVSIHSDAEERFFENWITEFSAWAFMGGIVKNGTVEWSDGTPYDYKHYFPKMGDHHARDGQCLTYFWQNLGVTEVGWQLNSCTIKRFELAGIQPMQFMCKFPV